MSAHDFRADLLSRINEADKLAAQELREGLSIPEPGLRFLQGRLNAFDSVKAMIRDAWRHSNGPDAP